MKLVRVEEVLVKGLPWFAVVGVPLVAAVAAVLLIAGLGVDAASTVYSRAAIAALFILFTLATLAAMTLHGRYLDAAAERHTLGEQVRMTQEHNTDLRGQVEVLAAMREVGRVISDDVDFCKILDQVFQILERLLMPEEISVIVKEESTGQFLPRAIRRNGQTLFNNIDRAEAAHALFDRAIAMREMQKSVGGGRATLVSPLIVDREVAGAIKFVLKMDIAPEDAQKKVAYAELVIHDIARHIAIAIKTPSLHDRATIDGLTGLYSRRHFENQLRAHTNLARRYGKMLSLIMIDIDHFKEVNDQHGHLAGDVVLNAVATAVKANVRDCDSVYRYGGEEFTVILPETSAVQSQAIAERLRRTISDTVFTAGTNQIRVTLSLGVAEFDSTSRSHEDIVARADQALYASKKEGRNRTCVWMPGGPQLIARR